LVQMVSKLMAKVTSRNLARCRKFGTSYVYT
jgi:hypothetical protein